MLLFEQRRGFEFSLGTTSMHKFKNIKREVTEIVNDIDPDNLTHYGAPADEYSTQVHNIISLLSREKRPDVWEDEIRKIFFVQGYEPEDAQEKIKRLVEKLKEILPNGISLSHIKE